MRAREPTSEPTALPRSVVGHAAGCGLRCICSRVLLPRLLLLRFRQQFGRVRLQGLRFLLLCKRILICGAGRLCCTARRTAPRTFPSPLLCRSGLEHLAHDSHYACTRLAAGGNVSSKPNSHVDAASAICHEMSGRSSLLSRCVHFYTS